MFNTAQEVSLGQEMDQEVQKKLVIVHDPEMEYRLNSIGSKVAAVSDRQDLVYYFRIVKDNRLNAFSMPGGFVYVNTALMRSATDDELAGVLSHEIGHIAAKHGIKQLQAMLGYQAIMGIALGMGTESNLQDSLDIIFNLGSLGYSRKDEFFADKLAVKYTKKAGYDPNGLVTFFGKLKKEAQEKGSGFNLLFLSSHPPINERIKNIEQEISSNP